MYTDSDFPSPSNLDLLIQSAEAGNAKAQCIIGRFYLIRSSSNDLEKARIYLQRAADQEYIDAYLLLAICLERQKGARWNEYIFHYYKLAAEHGNATAQWHTGEFYEQGLSVDASWPEAIKYYKLASDQNYPPAIAKMGYCYEHGVGVEKNQEHANEYYQKSYLLYKGEAEIGNPHAQWHVGLCYENGKGIKISKEEAFRFYKLAADQNYLPAMEKVGSWLAEGIGVEKSNECAEYYEKSVFQMYKAEADQGNPFMQWHVGLCYDRGKGVQASPQDAFNYFKLAVDNGYMTAASNLAKCYAEGKGVEKDAYKAVNIYRMAADTGDILAQIALGDAYNKGYGVQKSDQEAKKYYSLAANQGSSYAWLCLGEFLSALKGNQESSAEAFHAFKMAADLGSGIAQYRIARQYLSGGGVDISEELALHYFTLAAQQNVMEARFFLKYRFLPLFESNIYPIRNPDSLKKAQAYFDFGKFLLLEHADQEAFRWFKKAAIFRHVGAWMALAQCYYEGKSVQPCHVKAYQYWRRASNRSYSALYNLGLCFEYAIGTPKNEQEMFRCYLLAAQNGVKEAKEKFESWFSDAESQSSIGIPPNQEMKSERHTLAESLRLKSLSIALAMVLGISDLDIAASLVAENPQMRFFDFDLSRKILIIKIAGMDKLIEAAKNAAKNGFHWNPGDFSFCGSDPRNIEGLDSFIAAIPDLKCKNVVFACPLSDDILFSLMKSTSASKNQVRISLKHLPTRERFLVLLKKVKDLKDKQLISKTSNAQAA